MSTIYKITIERVTTERRVVKQWVKLYDECQGDEDQYGYRGVEHDVKEGVCGGRWVMRAWFEWLDTAGWEGDVVVVWVFVAIAVGLAQLERR